MPMVLVVTDSDAMAAFERELLEKTTLGFTVVPRAMGRGRSGVHAGDRVHPGGTSMLFVVVPPELANSTTALLRGVRDVEGVADRTRLYVLPAEEIL